jgi:hypothetical protein
LEKLTDGGDMGLVIWESQIEDLCKLGGSKQLLIVEVLGWPKATECFLVRSGIKYSQVLLFVLIKRGGGGKKFNFLNLDFWEQVHALPAKAQ